MVCDEKYFKGPGFTCTKCSANMWVRMAPVVVAAVVSVLTTFAVLTYLVLTEGDGTSHRIMTRLLRRFPRHSVKTIIIAWQILTQVSGNIHSILPVPDLALFREDSKNVFQRRSLWRGENP